MDPDAEDEFADVPLPDEVPVVEFTITREFRAALQSLDDLNLVEVFSRRPSGMRTAFRNALRVAIQEALSVDERRSERGWKLLLMLPRMLLFKPPRKGTVAKEKLMERLEMFRAGRWGQLLAQQTVCKAGQLLSRRSRRGGPMTAQRADRALHLVQLGELSSARQALEGAEVAPGDRSTLAALQDPVRRPAIPRDPLPGDLLTHVPASIFELDKGKFSKNLRSARRGAAGGPSRMTVEHLQPLLDHPRALHNMFLLAERLARADVPPSIVDAIRQGRLTALRKPSGGVRGIVIGDVIRRVVARTLAQQLGPAVEGATAPFQYALSTKAGCECVSHVVQALTEADPETTVVSIDGVSAFDLISREAMLEGLMRVDGGSAALPFVRLFYGRPSQYLWEDSTGTTHTVHQGEGGEQGDPLMPLLYSVGQHRALEAISRELLGSEKLLAYLDDIYVITRPDRVGDVYTAVRQNLWIHACVSINNGKTNVWNAAGHK